MFYMDRTKTKVSGKYLFTLDWYSGDANSLDDGYSENPGQHKCGHVIERDDGNFAIQPNNRIFALEPSFTTKPGKPVIHRLINTRKWDVEDAAKWVTEDSDAYHYDISNMENEGGPVVDEMRPVVKEALDQFLADPDNEVIMERLKYMEDNGI
jgi:hypothetical protein